MSPSASLRAAAATCAAASALVGGLAVALAGCGDDAGRTSTGGGRLTAPTVTTATRRPSTREAAPLPLGSTLAFPRDAYAPEPGAKTTRVGAVTVTPFARYPGHVALAVRQNTLAVAVGGPHALRLLFGPDGTLPKPAVGAGPIPIWARIHIGTAAGPGDRTVVTYPRCATARLSSCDIYEWNPRARREQILAAASKPGRADIEASVDGGNVLRVTSLDPQLVVDRAWMLDHGTTVRGKVTLQERRRATHVVAATGAYDAVIDDGKLGFVQTKTSAAYAEVGCESRTVRLLSEETRRTQFRHTTPCDLEEGGQPVGIGFASGQLLFGLTTSYGDGAVYAHPIDAGPARQTSASLHEQADDIVPDSSRSAYVLRGSCDGVPEGTPGGQTCTVGRVTGFALGG